MDMSTPLTLAEAIWVYADEQVAHDFVVALRWPDGVTCPDCGGSDLSFVSTRWTWKCKNKECARQSFSVKVGTIFEDSPIKLGTWLAAIWMIANAKNGISSYEIHRSLGITQKSAWFVLHRIRLAMQTGTFAKLSGEVEADETFVGGKRSNMLRDRKRDDGVKGTRGSVGKVAVLGIIERDGVVRAKVVSNVKKSTLCAEVAAMVEPGSTVYTDALASYDGLNLTYTHQTIDHKQCYGIGETHTNHIEYFWTLFKLTLKGTYIHMDARHLDALLDEQTFRFNTRKGSDGQRFAKTVEQVSGKRLTYNALKGRN